MTLTELSGLATDYWGLWMMALFLGIVAWAFWPSKRRQEEMDEHAMIPFREDEDLNDRSRLR